MKKAIYILVILICVSVLLYNVYTLITWAMDNKRNKQETTDISQLTEIKEMEDSENTELINPPLSEEDAYWGYVKEQLLEVNIEELKNVNPDTVGYISVQGTNINYPVVQAKDNKYYLTHSFKKNSSKSGWIFADCYNNMKDLERNTVIYGHNRLDGTQFSELKNVLKSSWLNDKSNYLVKMCTETDNTLWQVFAVYSLPAEAYYTTKGFRDDPEYAEWLKTALRRSAHNFETDLNLNDKVLTLSTCESNNNRVRIVLQAKLIKKERR